MLLSDKYPFLTEYFTRALSTNVRALPQSILFYGNDADAQFTFATEIARLLNCTSDKSDNCECLNCRWIREHVELVENAKRQAKLGIKSANIFDDLCLKLIN